MTLSDRLAIALIAVSLGWLTWEGLKTLATWWFARLRALDTTIDALCETPRDT